MGDTAYGDGRTRQDFADVGRQLVARMPGRPRRAYFAKEDFLIDVEADTCTCPAGNVAGRSRIRVFGQTSRTGWNKDPDSRTVAWQQLSFEGAHSGLSSTLTLSVTGGGEAVGPFVFEDIRLVPEGDA